MSNLYFVPPGNVLGNLLGGDDGQLTIKLLTGLLGSGKTTILRHVESSFATRRPTTLATKPVRIGLEEFDPGHHGDRGPEASVGAVQASYQMFSAVLTTVLECFGDDAAVAELRRKEARVRQNEVYENRVTGLAAALQGGDNPLTPTHLADSWRRAAAALAGEFRELWNRILTGGEALILLDNFDAVDDQELGPWLAELLSGLPGTVLIVATESDEALSRPWASSPRAVAIPPLGEKDVEKWLLFKVQDTKKLSRTLVEQVHTASRGHPATLALVHELVWVSGQPVPPGPHPLLADLPESRTERLAVLAQRFVQQLQDPSVGLVIRAAAVPRYFDIDLIDHLLRAGRAGQRLELDRFRLGAVLQTVKGFSFVEELSDDTEHPRLRIHPAVRRGMLEQLRRTDPKSYRDLHRAAADYYAELLSQDVGSSSAYGEASIYEDLGWQRAKREWCYHSGMATDRQGQTQAMLQFTRLFLDAFFWWGCYIHFDFCDQIVSDLESLTRQDVPGPPAQREARDMRDLHRALRTVLCTYPLGTAVLSGEQWGRLRDSLLSAQFLCGLQKKGGLSDEARLAELDPLERQVAALLTFFIGDTWRYAGGTADRAERYYARAEIQFADDWAKAWVAFHRSELAREEHDDTAFVAHWCRSRRLRDADDDELAADLRRLLGDAAWDRGRLLSAAAHYGRAVRHAYLFNFTNGDPDEYTMQFYIDIRARALRPLFGLWNEGRHASAVGCALRMSAAMGGHPGPPEESLVRECFGSSRPVRLALLLFPRGPEVSELELHDTAFGNEYRAFHADLGHGL